MSPLERSDMRKIWVAILIFMVITIISQVLDLPSRISGMRGDIKELEFKKMNKDDANIFFNDLNMLLGKQCSKWDEYMLANEKDKERILKDIEIIQEDIKQLIGKNRTVTRSVQSQSSTGGKTINP